MRVVVADDEPVARERMLALLAEFPNVRVVRECRDGREVLQALEELEADGLFLDIQMPELDGFEVVRAAGPESLPPVVFVTAYDSFAIQAFEVRAIDYLLKPFDADRLATAVRRLEEMRSQRGAAPQAALLHALLDEASPRLRRFVIRQGSNLVTLQADDVDWLSAEGNYVKLRAGRAEHLVRGTISGMESCLDPRRFARIHRSAIVNLDRVRELQPMFRGEWVALLHDGTKLRVTPTYRDALIAALGPLL